MKRSLTLFVQLSLMVTSTIITTVQYYNQEIDVSGFQPTSAPGRSQGSRAQTHPGARLPPRTLTLHGSHQPDPRLLRERPVLTSLRPRSRGSQTTSVSDCPESNIRPHVADLPTAWPALVAPVAQTYFRSRKTRPRPGLTSSRPDPDAGSPSAPAPDGSWMQDHLQHTAQGQLQSNSDHTNIIIRWWASHLTGV